MVKELVPFWEVAYQSNDVVTFSSEPNATIKEFQQLFAEDSRVLDVGKEG